MSVGNHQKAPELRVPYWIDGDGNDRAPLKLSELGNGYKIIYCFQSWCQGCHSRGFRTLKKLVDNLSGRGFGFAVVQTVFEGEDKNTREKLRETQAQYKLNIPFGHDSKNGQYPSVMEDYKSGGTPWFILINPKGEVVFNDFGLDADKLINAMSQDDVELAPA